jgi:hypothetical protein
MRYFQTFPKQADMEAQFPRVKVDVTDENPLLLSERFVLC